ncbi:MAG: methyltransferase [Planctomycetota bacterium]
MSILEMDLGAGADDWKPTPHGIFLGDVIAAGDFVEGKSVLELGAGVANHTILMLRKGAARIVATEITEARLATARANVERNCPDLADRVEYRVADWLATPGEFDIVVTNPPFAKSGQRNRRYFIDELILRTFRRLREGGELLYVQSSMADVPRSLRRLDENGYDARIVESRAGPFRDYYFEDPTFLEEASRVDGGFEKRDDVYYETLSVLHGTLRPFTPPEFAH